MADRCQSSVAAANQRFFVGETSWSRGRLTVRGPAGAMGEGDSHPILQGASLFFVEAGLEPRPEPRGEELGGLSGDGDGLATSYKEIVAKTATQEWWPVCKCNLPHGAGGMPVDGEWWQAVFPFGAQSNFLHHPAVESACGGYAIVSDCVSGEHHFGKKLYCGREWCKNEDCQTASHKRRQARLLPKIQQVRLLSYLVIEFPEWARHVGQRGFDPDLDNGQYIDGWCYSKADLRDTTSTIVDVLAGERCGRRGRIDGYFSRGLGRWHWFGEECLAKWNPHDNILVDFESLSESVREEIQPAIEARKEELRAGKQTKKVRKELRGIECYESRKSAYMPEPLLDKLKADLRAALNVPDLIVHYSYCDTPGQMIQKVRYITKSTFRNFDWNPYMADQLYNFRNVRWWGDWKREPVWGLWQAEAEGEDVDGLQAVNQLQDGICPDCGQPLKVLYHNHKTGKPVCWSRPVDSVYLELWGAVEIAGTGYYRIPHREWSGYSFSPEELLRLEKLEAAARDSPSVFQPAVVARQRLNRKLAARQESESWWQDTLSS